MNKIEKLIEELCPDGVEYYIVEKICEINRGRVMSKDYLLFNKGEYPVFSSQTQNNGIIGKIKTFDYEGEYITWTTDGANAGTVFYREGKFSLTNVCGLLKVKVDFVNCKFLKHILSITTKKFVVPGSGNPKLMSNVFARIKIPIPPLKVQEEIVKILDNFTALEAELEAELEARKLQYDYYKNQLFVNSNSEKYTSYLFNDIAKIYDGTHQTPNYKESGVKFVSVENIDSLYESTKFISESDYKLNFKNIAKINDLFMTRIGTIGKCKVIDQDIPLAYYVTLALIKPNTEIVKSRYLKYFIESKSGILELNKKILFNAVPIKINLGDIGKLNILVPSIKKQDKIIKILDNFDSIVNDITTGLPAEIKARKQQYEYYRNQLLTFKEYKNPNSK